MRAFWGLIPVAVLIAGCKYSTPEYPHEDFDKLNREAQEISDSLEAYINAWFDGDVPAEIPRRLLPDGLDEGTTPSASFRLVSPDEITGEEQFAYRKAEDIDLNALHSLFPDPHCTYLVLMGFWAPFGHTVHIKGDFPHCRYFSIQLSPPFYPGVYQHGYAGEGEVPINDVDINPDPGHVNPFRVGSDRNAGKRGYHAVYTMALGNRAQLEPDLLPPYWRKQGNHRIGGGMVYRGPYGDPDMALELPISIGASFSGRWGFGEFWIRYYAPDKDAGPFGGVALPKVHYETPDGRAYFIACDWSGYQESISQTWPAAERTTPYVEPAIPANGWGKMWGIFDGGVRATYQAFGYTSEQDMEECRRTVLGVTGRGEDQPPPGCWEESATCCPNINYLTRGVTVDHGATLILTGKMPSFPDTRDGAANVEPRQIRYWSLTSYSNHMEDLIESSGAAITSLMDDEVTLDGNRWYIIAYSRQEDRPSNATRTNGVTWVNWGPTGHQGFVFRWLGVYPDHYSEFHPDEKNLPFSKAVWTGSEYDSTLIAVNDQKGLMKEYLPFVRYYTKQEFEALGKDITPSKILERRLAVGPARGHGSVMSRSSCAAPGGTYLHSLNGRALGGIREYGANSILSASFAGGVYFSLDRRGDRHVVRRRVLAERGKPVRIGE